MLTLGIDTSNYATSLAVVDAVRKEVVCAKKRFLPVKEGGLGLRQSEALFHHTIALPALLEELCADLPAGAFASLAGVGVSDAPRAVPGSYMPCFLAGISFATAFAADRGGFVDKPSKHDNAPKHHRGITSAKEATGLRDDTRVVMQGHIVEKLGKDKYMFRDASGTIRMDIDDAKWHGQKISPKDNIEIHGEVDRKRNHVEIDVDRVVKLPSPPRKHR